MSYSKEIILSDLLTQGIPDSMIRHLENVNIEKQTDPFKQQILAKMSKQGSNLDNFQVEEPDILNMARTSGGLKDGDYSSNEPKTSGPQKITQSNPKLS